MAQRNNYTNYYTDVNVEDRGRSLADFYVMEYRFRVNADEINHVKIDSYFKGIIQELQEHKILNLEYYTYRKEEL